MDVNVKFIGTQRRRGPTRAQRANQDQKWADNQNRKTKGKRIQKARKMTLTGHTTERHVETFV